MRAVPILIIGFIALLLGFMLMFRAQRPRPQLMRPQPMQQQPMQRRLHAPNGGAAAVTSADWQGALERGEIVDAHGHPLAAAAFPAHRQTFVYFGGAWCAPCRAFVPRLAAFYSDAGPSRPFNLIMVDVPGGTDATAADQQQYAEEMRMPWPLAKFESPLAKRLMAAYQGRALPELVLIDSDGQVLADSMAGSTDRGPGAVLEDYRILARHGT